MTFEEFAAADLASWLERTRSEYIAERIAAGDTWAEAAANADASLESTFPGGAPGPGQMTGWVCWDGVRVGQLWIGPHADDPQRWWVWNVAIDEARRGQGLGRRTMGLAERLAAANGATTIGLNVFAHNAVARGLYRSLGYEETSVQMRKSLLVPPDPGADP
jgi:ribosomal protein S18 acetylase RimI-like enzyme